MFMGILFMSMYLSTHASQESDLLRDRLYHAQGYKSELGVAPTTPFQASSIDDVKMSSRNTFTQPTSSTHATGGGVYGSNMGVATSYPQGMYVLPTHVHACILVSWEAGRLREKSGS